MNWIIAILAAICAYIVKGMSGFANTLVFSTILSFSSSTVNVTPVELILGYPSNLFLAWKERKKISFKIVGPLSFMVVLGSIPGAFILKTGNVYFLKVILGLAVIFIGIEMLLREKKKQAGKSSPFVLAVIGIISGILCGLFGIGAFLAAYVSRTTDTQSQFKGNQCFVFLIDNTFRLILYSVTGVLNFHIIMSSLLLFPFMVIGLFVGINLSEKINESIVKKVVIILLILSGASLMFNNIADFLQAR